MCRSSKRDLVVEVQYSRLSIIPRRRQMMGWNNVPLQKVRLPEPLCANYPVNEWGNCLWLFRLDPVRGFDQVAGFGKPSIGIVMQRAERLAALHGIPDALVKLESYGRVNRVFLLFPAPAQDNGCHAELLALRRGDE